VQGKQAVILTTWRSFKHLVEKGRYYSTKKSRRRSASGAL